MIHIAVLLLSFGLLECQAKSDPSKTQSVLSPGSNVIKEQRPLLAGSKIFIKLECDSATPVKILIYWTITENKCWYDVENPYLDYENQWKQINSSEKVVESPEFITDCPNHLIVLPEVGRRTADKNEEESLMYAKNPGSGINLKQLKHPLSPTAKPVYTIQKDGIYNLELTIQALNSRDAKYSAPVYLDIIGPHGYISAIDWPLLPFFGVMCIVYVILGIIWLLVSFMQWRDLLRIQFWIGGVIFLGMLEKAFFYAQYHSLNNTGIAMPGVELSAEFVSCAKRTLARMLVIIMSLGFGIVKPRLGPLLHRVLGVGALYFVLACVESYLRITKTKNDERNELLVASIPLAVLDTGICWWIFTSLVQTTRTLRLRRNTVKLSLYKHFTNTLIFSVIASLVFMLSAMQLRKKDNCTPGWHEIWIDTAFWHVLFSILLLVIMILWRPTNNNQRYAFTPLLDNPEDEEDDDEEDQFVADAYGVKMRGVPLNGQKTGATSQRATTTDEDDLRWVEDNIPSSLADPALPILDSDEEIMNTKFEVSKMQ